MIDISNANIESLVIHKIGMKAAAEEDPKRQNFYSNTKFSSSTNRHSIF